MLQGASFADAGFGGCWVRRTNPRCCFRALFFTQTRRGWMPGEAEVIAPIPGSSRIDAPHLENAPDFLLI